MLKQAGPEPLAGFVAVTASPGVRSKVFEAQAWMAPAVVPQC